MAQFAPMAQPLTPVFDPHAGSEAVLYIARSVEDPTFHRVLKLRYEADKLHLGRYGHFASGDWYTAMRFGPVGSNTYNLMRAARGDESPYISDDVRAIAHEAFSVAEDGETILPKRSPSLDLLSDSDRACLDEIIARDGRLSFDERVVLTHGPAWTQAWQSRAAGQKSVEMPTPSIAAELGNADEVLEFLQID